MTDTAKCDMCGNPVGEVSLDLWAFISTYTEHGDNVKTGEAVDPDYIPDDYIMVCDNDCAVAVAGLWHEMVAKIKGDKE